MDWCSILFIESPVELAVGNNIVRITVTAENGDIKIYTVNIIREAAKETEVTPVNNNVGYEQKEEDNNPTIDINSPSSEPEENEKKSNSNISKIIVIILIILVIAGLIYLIFKDDDDAETKKANKDIDKLIKSLNEKSPISKRFITILETFSLPKKALIFTQFLTKILGNL